MNRVAQLEEDDIEEDEDPPPTPAPQVELARIDKERDGLRQQVRDAIIVPLRMYHFILSSSLN